MMRVLVVLALCTAALAARPSALGRVGRIAAASSSSKARQLLVSPTCPPGCDVANGGCVLDGTGGGYRCTSCLNSLVVSDADGTCGCPAGRYAAADSDCSDCPKGSWCAGGRYTGVGAPAATECGGLLTTLGQRSTSIKACVNSPGSFYTLDASGAPGAVTCPADTWGGGLKKQRICVPCVPGYTTNGLTGRSKNSDCLVPAGFFNKAPGQVAPCPPGAYKAGLGLATQCTPCPRGVTTAKEASTSAGACSIVLAGLYAVGLNGTMITSTAACPQRFFCNGGTPTAPFVPATFDPANAAAGLAGTTVGLCPNGTWTEATGASSQDQCMTPPGFKTTNGTTTPCANGEYRAEWKVARQATSCDVCGDGILSLTTDFMFQYALTADATRTNVPVRSSSTGCYIRSGQGMLYAATSKTYRAVNCVNNSYGVSNSTFGLAPRACMLCPTGMMADATLTPDLFTLVDGVGGFTSPKACLTQPGFGVSGREAVRCSAGFYSSPGSNTSQCTQCPFGTTTYNDPALQTSLASCVLAPGFGFHDGQIIPCPIGTYNDALRNDTITPCSSCAVWHQTTSLPGGSSPSACDLCVPGWGGSGSGSTNRSCDTQCGGASGATYGPAGRDSGTPCLDCPVSAVGFVFDYAGDVNMNSFVPDLVAQAGASQGGDCLWEFVQFGQELSWYLGGNASLAPVPASSANFSACVADCKADANCEYITYDYQAADGSRCQKKVAGTGSDVIAYKAVTGGDTSTLSIKPKQTKNTNNNGTVKAKALASGSYTYWKDDASGIGATLSVVSAGSSVRACLAACDDNTDCAAVVMTGLTSSSTVDSQPAACSLVKGDATLATYKRSMTKAVTSRFTLAAVW